MSIDKPALMNLIEAIVRDEKRAVVLLASAPSLAKERLLVGARRDEASSYFFAEILHYVYAGDTALHLAAATYRPELARTLVKLGASVAAKNRRGAEPLHYAVDGGPGLPSWDPRSQAATVDALLQAGADVHAVDKTGTTPLHRAVRNRCAEAVRVLLEGGADVQRKNKSGNTAARLATMPTGRGGTGTPEAKAQLARIVRLLNDAS